MTHNQRPWSAVKHAQGYWMVVDNEGIVVVSHIDEETARLISATPDLFGASKEIIKFLDMTLPITVSPDHPVGRLIKAIAKAESK